MSTRLGKVIFMIQKMRTTFILNILKIQGREGVTATQIHDELLLRFQEDVSRKTVTRDLVELEQEGVIIRLKGYPARFIIKEVEFKQIKLTKDEIRYLNLVLSPHMNKSISLKIIQKLNQQEGK
jgi:predicted DNA-binding transcriptional regulator YafY